MHQLVLRKPHEVDGPALRAFETLVRRGGEVAGDGLAQKIGQAKVLTFLYSQRTLMGVGAIKTPLVSYRRRVFASAGCGEDWTRFPLEVGWIYVDERHRGQGLASLIVTEILHAADSPLFATARTNNPPMLRILEKHGFEAAGKPYHSSLGDAELSLLLRDAR